MADDDDDPELTALRWFGYLPKRVSEPLLAEWAQPLWDYCLANDKGITGMQRLRGKAWLCEPSSEALRGAISCLGKRGELRLPENFPVVADCEEDYGAVAAAAD